MKLPNKLSDACLLATVIFLACSSIQAAVIHVPSEQPTIQAGVNAASIGDTVLVAPGIYAGSGNRDIDLNTKGVRIISQSGAEFTTIDCEGTDFSPHRAFIIEFAVDTGITIQGFTIRNGYSIDGSGAILVKRRPGLTIADCVFENNFAKSSHGGALNLSQVGTIAIYRCSFLNNHADYTGGAIRLDNVGSGATIEDCLFAENTAGAGGALALHFARPAIVDCSFEDNSSGRGGAVTGLVGSARFSECKFLNNVSSSSGGALFFFESAFSFDNCVLAGNSALIGGALTWETPLFQGSGGFGVSMKTETSLEVKERQFTNCTFYDNYASDSGSVVFATTFAIPEFPNSKIKLVFQNCILSNNTGSSPVAAKDSLSVPQFECSDIYNNENGDWVTWIADQENVNGNFVADPLFCDTTNMQFRIPLNSPCAPTGNLCQVTVGGGGLRCDYICGDVNADDIVDGKDAVYLLDFYFHSGPSPIPLESGDINCLDGINLADLVYFLNFLDGAIPQLCCPSTTIPPDKWIQFDSKGGSN